jgi:hypothetical protein
MQGQFDPFLCGSLVFRCTANNPQLSVQVLDVDFEAQTLCHLERRLEVIEYEV